MCVCVFVVLARRSAQWIVNREFREATQGNPIHMWERKGMGDVRVEFRNNYVRGLLSDSEDIRDYKILGNS